MLCLFLFPKDIAYSPGGCYYAGMDSLHANEMLLEVDTVNKFLKAALFAAGAAAAVAAAAVALTAPGRSAPEEKARLYGCNVAHRGLHNADGLPPENSLAAFRAAAQAGYGAEMDVRLTADDIPVILHDNNTRRMCGVDQPVDEATLDALETLRLGDTQEQIPTLSQALDAMEDGGPVILELKSGERNDLLCEKVLDAIRDYDGELCVESFDPRIVAWFRKNAPDIFRGQLTDSFRNLRETTCPLLAFAVSHGLTNVIARPQFIAHGPGRKSLLIRLSELLGAMPVAWTAHSCAPQVKNDAVIFEYYRPLPRYKWPSGQEEPLPDVDPDPEDESAPEDMPSR